MKATHYLIVTLVVSAATLTAMAQAPSQPVPRAGAPTTAPTGPALNRVLPELKFDGVSINDVMEFLRDVTGDFQPTIVRDPGVPADFPSITLSAKNITIGQFLQFLQQAYGITATPIEGPGSTITTIRIPNNQFATANVFNTSSQRIGSQVQVYNIRSLVENLAAGKPENTPDRAKQAMNDVLSLVQAALDQSSPRVRGVLKVHEATQVLLFTGTQAQSDVVANVLKTLEGGDATGASKLQSQVHYLGNQLSEERSARFNADLDAERLRTEVQVLRSRLQNDAAAATTRPKE